MKKDYSYTVIKLLGAVACLSGGGTLLYYLFGGMPQMAKLTAVVFLILGAAIIWLAHDIQKHNKMP